MAKVAKAAGVPRESLYRALSAGGSPRFSTLHAILKAAGLRLSVERADSRKSATVVRADHRPSPSRS
jgi:DNA-binding phage protein